MNITVFLAAAFFALAMLAASMFRIRRLQKRAQKHDRVLFPFCQLRRDIMRFLRETAFAKNDSLSREEYAAARWLVDLLGATIRNYNHHKTVMFDLRKMEKHLRAYRKTVGPANPVPAIPDNPQIREFHKRFRGLLVNAFIAYTPLIRWKLILRLWAIGYQLGKEEGARRRRAEAKYVLNNAPKVRNDLQRYGAFDGKFATA